MYNIYIYMTSLGTNFKTLLLYLIKTHFFLLIYILYLTCSQPKSNKHTCKFHVRIPKIISVCLCPPLYTPPRKIKHVQYVSYHKQKITQLPKPKKAPNYKITYIPQLIPNSLYMQALKVRNTKYYILLLYNTHI